MPKISAKEAFQAMESDLHDTMCLLACAAAAFENPDEDLCARAENVVRQCVDRLQTLHEAMDRFSQEHLSAPKLQAVQS